MLLKLVVRRLDGHVAALPPPRLDKKLGHVVDVPEGLVADGVTQAPREVGPEQLATHGAVADGYAAIRVSAEYDDRTVVRDEVFPDNEERERQAVLQAVKFILHRRVQ